MALGNSGNNTSTTYLSFYEGFFTKKVDSTTEGAVMRINKNQVQVWELKYDTISGIIQSIEYAEKEFQGNLLRSWNIKMKDGEDYYELQMPYSSRATTMILLKLPNINPSEAIELRAYWFEKDKKSAIAVYQKGKKIEAFWTKDAPKDLPQMEQVMYKGKLEWDDSKMMAYLRSYIENDFAKKLSEKEAEAEEAKDDNLPF
jgi:hypothetical protein